MALCPVSMWAERETLFHCEDVSGTTTDTQRLSQSETATVSESGRPSHWNCTSQASRACSSDFGVAMPADGPSCVLSNSRFCFATTSAMIALPLRPKKLVYALHSPLQLSPQSLLFSLNKVLIVSCKSILSVCLSFAVKMSLVHPLFVHGAMCSESGYFANNAKHYNNSPMDQTPSF